jgi:hypothetical protein
VFVHVFVLKSPPIAISIDYRHKTKQNFLQLSTFEIYKIKICV